MTEYGTFSIKVQESSKRKALVRDIAKSSSLFQVSFIIVLP